MTIHIKRYVDISSGVGAAATIRQRELIGLLFTSNPQIDLNSRIEMSSAAEVASFFGSDSIEAKRAAFYFDFISKTITTPKKIAFARFAKQASFAQIFGDKATISLDAWHKITNGSLGLNFAGISVNVENLSFSEATALSDVAEIIQHALQQSDAVFAQCLLMYDAQKSAFHFNSNNEIIGTISIGEQDENSIAAMLGFTSENAIFTQGCFAQSAVDAYLRAAEYNNNFGSFAFIDTIDNSEIIEIATQNSGRNIEFMYCVPVNADNATLLHDSLINLSGVCLTLAPNKDEYDEMAPMIILASTDYDRRNATQNYMFQQFNLTPKVDNAQSANHYDDLRVNYIGITQTAGQIIQFYQRGIMTGLATSPVDMNTYANEMWFKDAAQSSLMTLLMSMPKVSANKDGRGQVIAILQDAIDRALYNGTISMEKPLSTTQKLYIGQMTGDDEAWRQVQSIGYWLNCDMKSQTSKDGRSEWIANYLLIYSKDDVVRKIEGTHTLI